MSALTTFSFENLPVRTFGTADAPLFIALDVCNALGFDFLLALKDEDS